MLGLLRRTKQIIGNLLIHFCGNLFSLYLCLKILNVCLHIALLEWGSLQDFILYMLGNWHKYGRKIGV